MSEQEEQQTEKKKAKIAVKVLRWLSFGLITLLLIVFVVFQGPWKVSALLGILAASYFLPKPYGKYFWLCVGGVVIALIIWVFLPEETKGWRPYTFDKELAAIKAKYAIPDEENAAIIYNQLLEDYNKAAFEPNFTDPNLEDLIRNEPWLSKDYPEANQWIDRHENTIITLTAASQMEKCRFPINANFINDRDMMDRVGAIRKWAILLISAANNDIAEGRTNQGIEKYTAAIQMGKHQCQQSALIDMLVGIGIENLCVEPLNRLVVTGDITEEQLMVIENTLIGMELDWSSDLPRFVEYEKLCNKNFLGMFYGVSPDGKIRLNPSAAARAMKCLLPEDMKEKFVMTYWRERSMKASTIWLWFHMPPTPQKAGEIIDSAYERYYAMAEPDFDWRKEPAEDIPRIRLNFRFIAEFMASMLEGSYYSIHNIYLLRNAEHRGSRIIIALRRYKNEHGNWPVGLDEVKPLAPEEIFIDPINGGSFVYKLTDDNFTLYSKGKNNIDEGGQYNSIWDPNSHERTTEEDDRMIWPSEKGGCR